jgi:hypothetical protein
MDNTYDLKTQKGTGAFFNPFFNRSGKLFDYFTEFAHKSDCFAIGRVLLDSMNGSNFKENVVHIVLFRELTLSLLNFDPLERIDMKEALIQLDKIICYVRLSSENNMRLSCMKKLISIRGEIPKLLICPITLELMSDPVIDANGHTFERIAIERSLAARPGISPLTNAPYPNGDARLTKNYTVNNIIDEFQKTGIQGGAHKINKQKTIKKPLKFQLDDNRKYLRPELDMIAKSCNILNIKKYKKEALYTLIKKITSQKQTPVKTPPSQQHKTPVKTPPSQQHKKPVKKPVKTPTKLK